MKAVQGGSQDAALPVDATPGLDASTRAVSIRGSEFHVPDTSAMLLDTADSGVRLAPVTEPLTTSGTGSLMGPLTGPLNDPLNDPLNASEIGNGASRPRSGARPGVVQLAIREKAALYAAYMPFLDGGGLFVPTTRSVRLGDELYLILSLMNDPNRLSVTSKVVWITPPGTPQRQQGLGVQFAKDETGTRARSRIEDLLGGTLKANRPTHTI